MSVLINHSQKLFTSNIQVSSGDYGVNEKGFYFSVPLDSIGPYVVHLTFDDMVTFNQIRLNSIEYDQEFSMTVHFTVDDIWQRLPVLHVERSKEEMRLELPLTKAKRIQIIFFGENNSGVSSLKVGNGNILFYAKPIFRASSEENRLWVAENLNDGREDYGWSSQIHENSQSDNIEVDLGQFFYLNELRLRATKENPNYFPVDFSFFYSMDKVNWQILQAETNFFAASGEWYRWQKHAFRCRYLKIFISKPFRKKRNQYLSRILEMEFFGLAENEIQLKTENESLQTLASEVLPGMVVLAEANSYSPSKVVQGNDPRLRNASTEFYGIVQLARDGEVQARKVVQSNDSRLQEARVSSSGLVRLAEDGQTQAGRAVQANDSRLRKATTEFDGIVQLAKHNEASHQKALQSDDPRLRYATTKDSGIVQLAQNGEAQAGRAVQANDSRLRKATTEFDGIVQLAKHNEVSYQKALQSNDPRLRHASTEFCGIVQLAKDGESEEGKVMQSNDSRLKKASESFYGFSIFSRHGEKQALTAVQADDPRLDNAREALPHKHDYALVQHDFNSHNGKLNLHIDEEHQEPVGIEIPASIRYPFSVVNQKGYAAAFRGGIISRSQKNSSILALADSVTAIEGRSRQLPAAVLLSEKNFALHLPEQIGNLRSSGRSLKVEGKSEFYSSAMFVGSLAVWWEKFRNETFVDGDIVTIDREGHLKKISETRESPLGVYNRRVGVLLNYHKKKKDGMTIAIQGIVKVRVQGNVQAGDRIGYSFGDAGIGRKVEKGARAAFVGIAMDNKNDKNDLVYCLLRLE